MKQFILASSNIKKCQEIWDILGDEFEIKSADQSLDVEESGKTLYENAWLKAKAYYDHYKLPSLSDDSGLFVEALPEELGVRSARFGGSGLSDLQRCELLLEKISSIENRRAYFECVLCTYLNSNEVYFFEGRLKGQIAFQLQSESGGFGYDPLFIPDALKDLERPTLSYNLDWKRLNSHRAKALKEFKQFFWKSA